MAIIPHTRDQEVYLESLAANRMDPEKHAKVQRTLGRIANTLQGRLNEFEACIDIAEKRGQTEVEYRTFPRGWTVEAFPESALPDELPLTLVEDGNGIPYRCREMLRGVLPFQATRGMRYTTPESAAMSMRVMAQKLNMLATDRRMKPETKRLKLKKMRKQARQLIARLYFAIKLKYNWDHSAKAPKSEILNLFIKEIIPTK
jgi:hypothetical protein